MVWFSYLKMYAAVGDIAFHLVHTKKSSITGKLIKLKNAYSVTHPKKMHCNKYIIKIIKIKYEKLPLKNKIFSVRILSKKMEDERKEYIDQLEKLNELLNPRNFIKYKKQDKIIFYFYAFWLI